MLVTVKKNIVTASVRVDIVLIGHKSKGTNTLDLIVVRFGILERISIRSYVFATVGTVERPFPAKTYQYPRPRCLAFTASSFYLHSMYFPFATVEKELRSQLSGDGWFDVEKRTEYSTATCMVKVMPVGVVAPKNIEDVRHVVLVCAENDIAVIPRRGGSCLVGQALDPQNIFNPQKIIGRQDRAFLHDLKYA